LGDDVCVGSAADLHNALTAAQSSGGSDIIRVVQGTYYGNFTYSSGQGHSLTLLGGYTAGCSRREIGPANTVLDAQGSGNVLNLYNFDGGDISVDGFSIQNADTAGDGGGIFAESASNATAGNIALTNNIIRGNTSDQGGGGAYARSYSGNGTAATVILLNNIIIDNRANVGGGVFVSSYSVSGTPGTVTITNNTITGNNAGIHGGGAFLYANSSSPGGMVNCYNNIIWGNTSPTGADIDVQDTADSTTNGYNNDYSVISGSWHNESGNINLDPGISGNYHLRSASPCIDAGLNSAPGIPATDFEGNDRLLDGDGNGTAVVDIGAYESNFAEQIPVPVEAMVISCQRREYPLLGSDPHQLVPFGIGSVAIGLDILRLQLSLNPFAGPVDLYFGIFMHEIDPSNVYILTLELAFQPHSAGIVPWKTNVGDSIDESLFGNIPVSLLSPSTYSLYLCATPSGQGFSGGFYLWSTSFIVN
jgi:hypothetical protein